MVRRRGAVTVRETLPGQRDQECRPPAGLAPDADGAPVRLDERPDDVEAEPQALLPVTRRGAFEPPEDARLVLGRDAGAPVLDLDDGRVVVGPHPHGDRSAA